MLVGSANGCMCLVDAHSLIFQVFHAIPEMSSPSGLPTNALYGFTRDMLYLRTEKKPDYLLAVFDRPGKTFRDGLYPLYKAQRPPMPNDLQIQLPLICRTLEAMQVPVLGVDGYEADDVIATVAVAAARRGIEVFICTTDKDCRQLIEDHVQLFNLRKHAVLDREGLLKDWGIRPEQVVDLQTLVGDSVDNVPGVPGIGLKTAVKLLQQYGSLDDLIAECATRDAEGLKTLSRSAGIRSGVFNNLQSAIANGSLELSRKLVRLATDVPLEADWEAWRLRLGCPSAIGPVQRVGLPKLCGAGPETIFGSWQQRNCGGNKWTTGCSAPATRRVIPIRGKRCR